MLNVGSVAHTKNKNQTKFYQNKDVLLEFWVVAVKNRLAKFLINCILRQTRQIQSIKILLLLPKLCLIQYLIIQILITHWHDHEVRFTWKHHTPALRLQKLIPCDDICLQHALIKQVSAQRLTHDDIDGPLSNQALVDVLYLRLYHLYDVIELVVLY